MQDFPGNSRRAQERAADPPGEPKRIEQVTSADAELRQRGLGRKVKDTFIGGTARGAVEYVVADVVVPTIRDLLFESFQSGMERWVFGESRIRRSGRPSGYPGQTQGPQVNYSAMSTNKPTMTRSITQQSRARHDFGEIVIQDRREASDVLDVMYDELSRYGSVTVAVLYALTGIQSSHTDHKWGWTSLRGANVVRMGKGGYLLDLPTPEPLDR
jgi:hypothetical protein